MIIHSVAAASIYAALALMSAQTSQQHQLITAPPEKVERRVAFGDLDLTSPIDQNRLKARLRHAVTDVCMDAASPSDPDMVINMMRCNKSAWRTAESEFHRAIDANPQARAS